MRRQVARDTQRANRQVDCILMSISVNHFCTWDQKLSWDLIFAFQTTFRFSLSLSAWTHSSCVNCDIVCRFFFLWLFSYYVLTSGLVSFFIQISEPLSADMFVCERLQKHEMLQCNAFRIWEVCYVAQSDVPNLQLAIIFA